MYLTRGARNDQPTLGGLSWLVNLLIASGRLLDGLVRAYGWYLFTTIAAFAAAWFIFLRAKRRAVLPGYVEGVLAALLTLASIVSMVGHHYVIALALAVAAALFIIAGGPTREIRGFATARAWLVLIPLGVGAILRFWSLADIPRGFAQHAVSHLQISQGFSEALTDALISFDLSSFTDLWPMFLEQHGPMAMVDGLGFCVFGVGMVEARLSQAVLGCLAILVAYALGASLDGPRLGFLYSFLLAVSPWHLAFSRYGDGEHALPILQVLLAVFLIYRAARFGRTRDYVLGGVVFGLSWYVYATNQIVPVIAATFFAYKSVASRVFLKRDWTKLILMAAVFVVVSFPHISSRLEIGETWLARTPVVEFTPSPISDYRTIHETFGQLYLQVQDPWFLRSGGGLGPGVQALLIIGAISCLAGLFVPRRRDACVLLLLWLGLSFLPAFLSTAYFRRLLPTLVVALVLSSMAVLRILRLLEEGGVSRRVTSAFLIGLCAFGAVVGAYVYFEGVRIPESNHHIDHTQLALFVSRNIGPAFVYVYVPDQDYKKEVDAFVQLIAHRRIGQLKREGARERDLFEVVTPRTLPWAVGHLRANVDRAYLIAHRAADGVIEGRGSLRSKMAVEEFRQSNQDELLVWMCEGTVGTRDRQQPTDEAWLREKSPSGSEEIRSTGSIEEGE
jgi:hypothetical protein